MSDPVDRYLGDMTSTEDDLGPCWFEEMATERDQARTEVERLQRDLYDAVRGYTVLVEAVDALPYDAMTERLADAHAGSRSLLARYADGSVRPANSPQERPDNFKEGDAEMLHDWQDQQ